MLAMGRFLHVEQVWVLLFVVAVVIVITFFMSGYPLVIVSCLQSKVTRKSHQVQSGLQPLSYTYVRTWSPPSDKSVVQAQYNFYVRALQNVFIS